MVGQTCKRTPLRHQSLRPTTPALVPPEKEGCPDGPALSPQGRSEEEAWSCPERGSQGSSSLFCTSRTEVGGWGGGDEVGFQLPHWSGTDFVAGFFLFFFPLFFLFFFRPKRGEKELGKGRWPVVGGRGFSWELGAALMKPALGVVLRGASSRPSPSQSAGVSMTFLAREPRIF